MLQLKGLLITSTPYCLMFATLFCHCFFLASLLSELGADVYSTDDQSSETSESFAISRERSISAPDVYRSRIISGHAALVSCNTVGDDKLEQYCDCTVVMKFVPKMWNSFTSTTQPSTLTRLRGMGWLVGYALGTTVCFIIKIHNANTPVLQGY